jgi:hypothetical protein
MAIAFRAKVTGDVHFPASPVTITKPAGTVATDVLVAVFAFRGGDTITAPTGWTAVATGAGNATFLQSCWWALGSVAALGFTYSKPGADDVGWICSAFSGVDNTTPVDATGTTSTSTAALTVTANAVTVATANAYHLIAFSPWNAGTLSATGFTLVDNSPVTNQQVGLLYKSLSATGSTGTVTCTVSGSATGQVLIAIPFALRPAAAAAAFVAHGPLVIPQAVPRAAFY